MWNYCLLHVRQEVINLYFFILIVLVLESWKMILIKVHQSYRQVVSVCDKEILGKTFEEGKKFLDIRENFYSGKEYLEAEAIEILIDFAKEDSTFNIVGKESVQAALKTGIIKEDGVKTIQGIPIALGLL